MKKETNEANEVNQANQTNQANHVPLLFCSFSSFPFYCSFYSFSCYFWISFQISFPIISLSFFIKVKRKINTNCFKSGTKRNQWYFKNINQKNCIFHFSTHWGTRVAKTNSLAQRQQYVMKGKQIKLNKKK